MTSEPSAIDADRIITHMNEDHADANLAYARALCGITDATAARLVAVDRLGLDLIAETPGGERPARVEFDEPAETTDAVRRAVIALLEKARAT